MTKKKLIFIVISVLVSLLVYLPTPKPLPLEDVHRKQPQSVDSLSLESGVNALKDALFIQMPIHGPEDVEIDDQDNVYSGLADGTIIRISLQNRTEMEVLAKSDGPIYGVDVSKSGKKLVFADLSSGIKLLDLQTRQLHLLVDGYKGKKFVAPNSVVFGHNESQIYFTVSSEHINMDDFHEILLYGENTGSIYSYNMETNQTELLADHLYFVNGVEYSSDENCLYFVETSRSRLWRMPLQGPKRGQAKVILDNIFGYPDNVKLAQSGDLWIGIPTFRDSFTHILDQHSLVRRILINLRISKQVFMKIINTDYSGGIKVSKNGQILQYILDNSKNLDFISVINQKKDRIYLTSPTTNKIAVINKAKIVVEDDSIIQIQRIYNQTVNSQNIKQMQINKEDNVLNQIQFGQNNVLNQSFIQNTFEKIVLQESNVELISNFRDQNIIIESQQQEIKQISVNSREQKELQLEDLIDQEELKEQNKTVPKKQITQKTGDTSSPSPSIKAKKPDTPHVNGQQCCCCHKDTSIKHNSFNNVGTQGNTQQNHHKYNKKVKEDNHRSSSKRQDQNLNRKNRKARSWIDPKKNQFEPKGAQNRNKIHPSKKTYSRKFFGHSQRT